MAAPSLVSDIPWLGSGLGYRSELKADIFNARTEIDFLEIISDQFFHTLNDLSELEELAAHFLLIPHGVSMSIGSVTLPCREQLAAIKKISDITRSPYYSEHLCLTRAPGIEIGHLSPLWFTDDWLSRAITNVKRVQEYLEKPLVLENVTYLFQIPGGTMSQASFFSRLVEETGCGVLLDVTNVFTNSVNHGFDPFEFLGQMPLDNVVQAHIAGGRWEDGVLVDGHSDPVAAQSWNLLARLCRQCRLRGCILEHDRDFPDSFRELLDEVQRARQIMTTGMAGAS